MMSIGKYLEILDTSLKLSRASLLYGTIKFAP